VSGAAKRLAVAAFAGFALGASVTLLLSSDGDGDARAARGGERAESMGRGEPFAPAEVADLRERLERSEREREALQRALDAASPAAVSPEAAGEPAGSPRPRKGAGARFAFAGSGKPIETLDWDEAGLATANLMPLLVEAADVTLGRREMRPQLWGDITRTFAPIITHAVQLQAAGVDWGHPFALANLVHATLREAGEPLDAEQEEALHRIAIRFREEDDRRRGGYGAETLQLRKTLDEMRIQDRFHAEVESLLRPAQKAILHPPVVKGISNLDVFSGGVVWDQKLERIVHADRAELRQRLTESAMKELGLRAAVQPSLALLVGEWEAALPDEFVGEEPDAIRKGEMERTARVAFSATRQAAFFDALLAQAPLDEAERRRVVGYGKVFVPYLER